MEAILLLLLVSAPSTSPEKPAVQYKSEKTLQQIEQCLTERLSKRGDVTAVQAEGYVTLVYQDSAHRPMMIDVAPPNVTVTTDLAHGTRSIVKSCL